jgi:hypothetical protein
MVLIELENYRKTTILDKDYFYLLTNKFNFHDF